MRVLIHQAISIAILALMIVMVIAALRDMNRGGSLDDLTADEIKRAVRG